MVVLLQYEEHRDVPHPDIMGGDLNMVEDAIDRLPVKEESKRVTEAFEKLKTHLLLRDGWRNTYPDERGYTYEHSNHKSLARLDRIYTKQDILESSREWRIEESGIETDHKLVSVQITCEDAPNIGPGRWSIPDQVIRDKKFKAFLVIRLLETLREMRMIIDGTIPRTEEHNVQTLFQKFKDDVCKEAKRRQKEITPRLALQISKLEKDRQDILNQNDDPTTPEETERRITDAGILQEQIQELSKKLHQRVRDNVKYLHKIENETMSKTWTRNGKQRKPRDIIRALRKPVNHPRTRNTGTGESDEPLNDAHLEKKSGKLTELLRDYHEELQSHGIPEDEDAVDRMIHIMEALDHIDQRAENTPNAALGDDIQDSEITAIIKLVHKGKAAGIDGLTYEFWKSLLNTGAYYNVA